MSQLLCLSVHWSPHRTYIHACMSMYGHCSQLALASCSYLSQASHIFPVCGGKGGMGRENTLPFTFSLFLPLMGKIRLFVGPPLSLTPSDPCSLVRVKATAFKQFFEDNPDSLLRMVQVREGKWRWEGARHPSFSSLSPTSPLPSFFLRPSPSTLSLSLLLSCRLSCYGFRG